MRNKKIVLKSITIISLLFIFYQSAEAKFINLFNARVEGAPLRPGDEVKLAKFDILCFQKFHYNDLYGDSWGAIKAINPDVEIYTYTNILCLGPGQDVSGGANLNSLGRYDVDKGHSMGNVNGDHPEFFLLNNNGNRVEWTWPASIRYWLDFGDSIFQSYAMEGIVANNVGHPWTADGVISDHVYIVPAGTQTTPVKYNTAAKWSPAIISFINTMTVALAEQNQMFGVNTGLSRFSEAADGWSALDSSANPPAVVVEEGAFAANWGSGDIQFFTENQWKIQVNLLSTIENSKVTFKSSSDLAPGESGTDNYGKSFNFWDGLWYALGSYLLGKNDIINNSYFMYDWGMSDGSNIDQYYNEYDEIDLGKAVSGYDILVYSGNNIYWREFEKGYVYVNPTLKDVTSISLPELCKQRTHDNLGKDLSTLQNIDTINLKSHRAAILYKSMTIVKNLKVVQ